MYNYNTSFKTIDTIKDIQDVCYKGRYFEDNAYLHNAAAFIASVFIVSASEHSKEDLKEDQALNMVYYNLLVLNEE